MKFGIAKLLTLVYVISYVDLSKSCPTECSCFGFDGDYVVDCANRKLQSVPGGIEAKATELFLQGNQITTLDSTSFPGLTNLKYLYLHENALTKIGAGSFDAFATPLISLTLHGNEIADLPENIFANMASLKVLNLNGNKLTSLGSGLLTDAADLVQASFYENQIESVPDNLFAGLSKLRYIGLANNKLTTTPALTSGEHPELYLFDVADNMLDALPKVPSDVTQVFANGNRVTSLSPDVFSEAKQLYELFLVGNRIARIEDQTFAGATSLGWIDLAGNDLASVNDKMFQNLPKLQGLYLAENPQLNELSSQAFKSFESTLRRLSLNNCSFTDLDPTKLSYLNNSDLVLWLAGNPWHCDCAIKDFADFVVDKGSAVYDNEHVTCHSPTGRTGQQLNAVNRDALCSSGDENLALIISLSVVGGLALFGIATFFLYKHQKKHKGSQKQWEEISSGKHLESMQENGRDNNAYQEVVFDNGAGNKPEEATQF